MTRLAVVPPTAAPPTAVPPTAAPPTAATPTAPTRLAGPAGPTRPAAAARPAARPTAAARPTTPGGAALALLAASRADLVRALGEEAAGDRYAAAHLAALRAAAAVLAARARPDGPGRRGRPTSAWLLLTGVAPELTEWADFFAAGARKRAAAEAGLPSAATTREADDLVRDAEAFLAVVETTLGLAHQQVLARPATG